MVSSRNDITCLFMFKNDHDISKLPDDTHTQMLITGILFLDDVNLSKDNSLTHLLNNERSIDDEEDISVIKHSSYHTVTDLENIKLAVGSLNIMSLNCQSINAKFNELQIIVENLKNNPVSVICLQESWQKENSDYSLYNLSNLLINAGQNALITVV